MIKIRHNYSYKKKNRYNLYKTQDGNVVFNSIILLCHLKILKILNQVTIFLVFSIYHTLLTYSLNQGTQFRFFRFLCCFWAPV